MPNDQFVRETMERFNDCYGYLINLKYSYEMLFLDDSFADETINIKLLNQPFDYIPHCSGDVSDFLKIFQKGLQP